MADKETQRRSIQVDESQTQVSYANFCRVTGSPEELVIDFGMNTQPMGSGDQPVVVGQKIALNFFTAKRLLHALHVSVQRHESIFGTIETDIQKRMQTQPAAGEKQQASDDNAGQA